MYDLGGCRFSGAVFKISAVNFGLRYHEFKCVHYSCSKSQNIIIHQTSKQRGVANTSLGNSRANIRDVLIKLAQ